jgi:PleD family two-component response regulator
MRPVGCFVVDGDAVRRAEVQRRLVVEGLRVVPLPSVERALAVLHGIAPDILVVDMQQGLQQLDQLARAVRTAPDTRHAALFAIGVDVVRARAVGFDAVVPRGAAAIGAEVRRCVERGRLRLVRDRGFSPEHL